MNTSGFGESEWDAEFARPWDAAYASIEALETDLADVIDPDSLEAGIAIDESGQFLAWLDTEARMAAMPPAPPSEEAFTWPVAGDLSAAAAPAQSGPNKRKRRKASPEPEAEAVLEELEASMQEEPVKAEASAEAVVAEAAPAVVADTAEAVFVDAEAVAEAEPLAQAETVEAVAEVLPESFAGDAAMALENLTAEAQQADVEPVEDAPVAEAQAEEASVEAEAEAAPEANAEAEASAEPAVDDLSSFEMPKPKKAKPQRQVSEYGLDEVPLGDINAMLALADAVEAEQADTSVAEAEEITSDLQPEAEAIQEAYGLDTETAASIEAAAETSDGTPVELEPAVPEAVNAHDIQAAVESQDDAAVTHGVAAATMDVQPLDVDLETDSSVGVALAPEASNVPMMPATTTLRRHFDATDLVEAQSKLHAVLGRVPLAVFLGRAAERCSGELPGVSRVALAELQENGLVGTGAISSAENFRQVLEDLKSAGEHGLEDLAVADISDLGLDEVVLPMAGAHLMLTRLVPHPERSGRLRGTVTLSGAISLKSGASFLDAIVKRLESPITLMV